MANEDEEDEDEDDDDEDLEGAEGEEESEDDDEDGEGEELDGEIIEEEDHEEEEEEEEGPKRSAPPKKNKQRVLLLSSRGITHRHRHLLTDLHALLPHSKKDAKLDNKHKLHVLNELAELNNCNNCIYFEIRKHTDCYLWMSKTPNGPSVKFHVQNVHTMDELRMTGNALKGSRPILSFDKNFDLQPHHQLLKEMFTHIFGSPRTSRKLKPFIDHVLSFSIADDKIWFRNYQIIEKPSDNPKKKSTPELTLIEIGPRFVLAINRIFDGSFGGSTLYESQTFISPNAVRRAKRQELSETYKRRRETEERKEVKRELLRGVGRDEISEGVFE
ncbi:Brix domain-containing protein [Fimicolochytrium jonesii]|uniref:Brix domain-containing protein n=1 Tax=Fimicolochytrium jonesii TaxID=1396493 RepID=UPI0022FF42A2|nr:Brix domain-containing protein [Fimicolochytrium jonesii]KAI8825285.1 Brix domain-containing protein [Fimicolochytrium jonesii]